AADFQEVVLFGHKRKDWLARFLDLSNGIPSHDTFERVFAHLDQRAFQGCFARWMTAWHAKLTGQHLALDGKAVCGSASPSQGFRALHLVNVWATQPTCVRGWSRARSHPKRLRPSRGCWTCSTSKGRWWPSDALA